MRTKLSEEQQAFIKEAFQKMQTREHLLNLLNGVFLLQKLPAKELVTLKQLDFFSSSFKTNDKKRKRYNTFFIKKRSGNLREINAPVQKLKQIQKGINAILQAVYITQEQAYGFVPGKSIVENATIHSGANFILNVDIKDFFPSIQFRRAKIMLEKPPFNLTGERESLAFCIANLCTEDGVLPQGAPTSPLITNIICQRLDKKLMQFAQNAKAKYTRYADDITFSCDNYVFTGNFISRLETILKNERFELNKEKTRIQGKAYRQEVTGLTVNEKVNVNRRYLRSYRTLNHLYKTKGAEAALEYHFKRMPENVRELKHNKTIFDVESYIKRVIRGKYDFITMVRTDYNLKPEVQKQNSIEETFSLTPFTIEDLEAIQDLENNLSETLMELSLLSEPEQPYGKNTQKISTSKKAIIDKILAIWEEDNENGGFLKAMQFLKEQHEY